ncbi:hypothetical protein A6V29_00755 [Blastococcus sp. CCUG 61487]|nr:hypothetical protein A6V29_00755 [Blastococcus sp. CCUG 61487]
MSRPTPTTPQGTPSGSQIRDRINDVCTVDPSARRCAISTVQGTPSITPATASTMVAATSGSRDVNDRPSTSSRAYPYSSVAAGFQSVISPSSETVTMASSVEDRMAA